MKKFVIRIVAFTLFTIVVSQVIGYAFDQHAAKYNNKQLDHRAPWIFQQQNEELDFLILGSSRALNMLDVNTMNAELGKTGLNIASSGSGFAQNYLHLRKFTEAGNTYKTVIINADWSGFHSDLSYSYPFSDYAYMPLLNEDWVADIYLDEVPLPKLILWKVMPSMKYAEFNDKYPFYHLMQKRNTTYSNALWDENRGSQLLFDTVANFKTPQDTLTVYFKDADPIDQKYFDLIVEYCEEQGAQLIVYTAPYDKHYHDTRFIKPVLGGIDSMTKSKGIPYFNFAFDPIGNRRELFRDYTHLNGEGGLIFSRQFARELRENGYL